MEADSTTQRTDTFHPHYTLALSFHLVSALFYELSLDDRCSICDCLICLIVAIFILIWPSNVKVCTVDLLFFPAKTSFTSSSLHSSRQARGFGAGTYMTFNIYDDKEYMNADSAFGFTSSTSASMIIRCNRNSEC